MGSKTRKSPTGVALCGAIMLIGTAVRAATPIELSINQLVRVPFNATVTNVVVGNSKIADVSVVNTHSVVIVGKARGSTSVMVFDGPGRLIFDGTVNITEAEGTIVTLNRGASAQNLVCMPACEAAQSQSRSFTFSMSN